MIPFSVLDLAPIVEGSNPQEALARARRLATHADRLGYKRYWLAEHHNMPGIASAATAVMISHAGQDTKDIRLGAGGIMLPNHAPIMVAEQFGTLEAIYPGRIDLGLGRAPGGDQAVAHALRRTLVGGEDRFPKEVVELQAWLDDVQPGQRIQAVPGSGTKIPLWILGSSTFGAQLAAHLGLPYAFASHFAPQQMERAVQIYRETFQPSAQLKQPYVMLGYNMIAADTDAEAEHLASSLRRTFVNLRRGTPTRLAPPDPSFDEEIQPHEHVMLETILSCSAVGSAQTVKDKVDAFVKRTGADELILSAHIFDETARHRSYEIAADVRESLTPAKAAE
ncbi:LLM class flavin-dependent oxidoreductase [Henriciella sp. AS95]|uniref:LLM class flavin-dependent oxidoreductase n=1 Tax=Henriciella sp. AS95 TaxID=3135782 RepID=UPI00317E9D09